MGTRSVVAITDDGEDPVFLYRHMDGYPEGVQPTLDQFCVWIREGVMRHNKTQSAGWLVVLGYREELEHRKEMASSELPLSEGGRSERHEDLLALQEFRPTRTGRGWKVGAYEPCTVADIGTDVEWLHVINANNGTWHPAGTWEHADMREAKKRYNEISLLVERPGQSKTVKEAMEARINQADHQISRAYLTAIKETFEQLESGELPSWQPEAEEAPAPA